MWLRPARRAARHRLSPTTIWNSWPWRLTTTGWSRPDRLRDAARSRKLLSSKAFLGCLGLATMLMMGSSWTVDSELSGAGVGAGDEDRRAPSPRPRPCLAFMREDLLGQLEIGRRAWRAQIVKHDRLAVARGF